LIHFYKRFTAQHTIMALRCLSTNLLKNRNIVGPFMPLMGGRARDYHLQTCIRCSSTQGTGDKVQSVRQFSKVTDNVGTELYFEEIFEHGFAAGEDPLFDLRNYFYPESDDPTVIQLSNAGCVMEVLEVVTSLDSPSHEHITQSIATLHHLLKLSGFVGKADYYEDYRNNVVEFNSQLQESEHYHQLLELIHKNILKIPDHELGYIYMALRKFHLDHSSILLRDIYLRVMDNVDNMDIRTLSYLSVGLRNRQNRMTWRLGLVQTMPRLQQLLKECKTLSDLRKIVICFYNLNFIVSDRMMNQLKDKVLFMIDSGQIGREENPLRVIKLLNKLIALQLAKMDWHDEEGEYMYKVFTQFRGKCHLLSPVNAVMLCKGIKKQGEPKSVMYEVYDRLLEITRNKGFVGHIPMITVLSALLSVNPSTIPVKAVEEIVETVIDSPHLSDHVDDIFNIMRNVGLINDKLVDNFYISSFEALKCESSSDVIRFAQRYLTMHSVYTGNYLNREFEGKVVNHILEEIQIKDPFIYHPKFFVDRITLLIYFGHKLDENLVQKIHDFMPQFNAKSLLLISKAIDARMKKQGRVPLTRKMINPMTQILEDLNVKVNKASEIKIRNFELQDNEKLVNIADLLRNYLFRNDYFNEDFVFIKDKLIDHVNNGKVTPRSIYLLCGSVMNPRRRIESPDLLDCFVRFYLNRPDPRELHTEAIFKLLEICYDSGHVPDKKFLDLFCEVIIKDIDSLSGLRTLSAAFILCYYNNINKSLVTAIFSNEFMSRLDNEMDMSSNRKHYPKMLRRALMVLNRAVVLRYPEYGVPWFHSKYCEENQIFLRGPNSNEVTALKDEVNEHLSTLLGGWRYFRENSFSKYYNSIDFEVQFDDRGKPIDLSSTNTTNASYKVAVQVLPSFLMTEDTRNLAGHLVSNNKELELQGWRVININPFVWNSMQMGDYETKNKFLKEAVAL